MTTRDPLDRYYTPAWAVEALCERLPVSGLRVLEPCAGDGAVAEVLRRRGAVVVTGDLDVAADTDHRWDFPALVRELGAAGFNARYGRFDLVVTNPPYATPTTSAADVIRAALEVAPVVACLLRTSWLDVVDEREELLLTRPPAHLLALPRVGYRQPGQAGEVRGSQYPSAWMLWGHVPTLAPIGAVSKQERDRWLRLGSPQMELL